MNYFALGVSLYALTIFVRNLPAALRRRSENGFSLVEMMVVCLIVTVLACVALPSANSFQRALSTRNAVARLRSLSSAEGWYSTLYKNGYATPAGLTARAPLAGCDFPAMLAPDVNSVFALGAISGYTFHFAAGTPQETPASGCTAAGFSGFTAFAVPINPGVTGTRSFFLDSSGIIRFRDDGTVPGPTDAPYLQ